MDLLAATLKRLIDQKLTTAKEIESASGASTSTVYRWIAGESQPDTSHLQRLLSGLRDPSAQQALLGVVLAGSPWQAIHLSEPLDRNRDGQVDHDDALDALITGLDHTASVLKAVRAATRPPLGRMTAEQALEAVATLDQAIRCAVVGQRVLLELNQRRRQAKPLKLTAE